MVMGYIKFFLSAQSQKAIDNTNNRIKNYITNINSDFVFILKENHSFEIQYKSDNWEGVIFQALKLRQQLGTEWLISGDVNFELNLWTNHSKIVGVESINIVFDNPIFYADE